MSLFCTIRCGDKNALPRQLDKEGHQSSSVSLPAAPAMVMMSPVPIIGTVITNGVSRLQTELRHREGHEASRIGLEAIPLDEHIEGGHREREPGVKRRPEPAHDFREVANDGQHRQDRLDKETILPRAALTQCEVGGVTVRSLEGGIAQENHTAFKLSNEPLKGVICDIGGGTRPSHD
jgi:hypothetical protein